MLFSVLSIAQENQLPGTPQVQWYVPGSGDPTLQGFTTDISVNQGQSVHFKINDTAAAPYHLDIYRMGYYGGDGARLVTTIDSSHTLDQMQPAPLTDRATNLVDCGNWSESASWAVPSDATTGIYFARAVRDDTGGASLIFFVVRNDGGRSDLLFQTSDATWEAYNDYGGSSLYVGPAPLGRAMKVSYNRPLRGGFGSYYYPLRYEYPMVRFLEANGYDVSYFTDLDSDRNGALIKNHKAFLSVGHDEYWSGGQRSKVEAARDAGVNLAFFSGNECFWKSRWESSIDGSGTPDRTLVCYKEEHPFNDPTQSSVWTGTWRDTRFSPPLDGGKPENALSGTLATVGSFRSDSITVSSAFSKLRFWRNTSIASLSPGQTATLQGVLGYEWDSDVDNGFRPAGLFDLSSTTVQVKQALLDDYSFYGPGTETHSLTLYRAASGALVFGAGTIEWSWGLDHVHDGTTTPVNQDMRQATVNLLADMGSRASTLQPGLVPAMASADRTPPVSLINPAGLLTPPVAHAAYTVTGTAADVGGGVVAGVEVSTDGGATWHPASGTGTWAYTFTPAVAGSLSIRTRAVDDSGNLEIAKAGASIGVMPGAAVNAAVLLRRDSSTEGAWAGAYGGQGYDILGTGINVPSYATLTFAADQTNTWTSGATSRSAPQPLSGAARTEAAWYSGDKFTLDLQFTDRQPHQVALYLADWDRGNRVQTIGVADGSCGNPVAPRTTVSNFAGGQYLVYRVSGHVVFTFTSLGGYSALLSGVFIDAAPPSLPAGDVNGDSAVNFADLLALAQNYGTSNATLAMGDVTQDGTVGFSDLLVLAQNYLVNPAAGRSRWRSRHL